MLVLPLSAQPYLGFCGVLAMRLHKLPSFILYTKKEFIEKPQYYMLRLTRLVAQTVLLIFSYGISTHHSLYDYC